MPYKKLVYANQIETFFTFFQFSELFQKLLNTNPFLKKETVQRIAFRQDVPLKSSLFHPFSALQIPFVSSVESDKLLPAQ
jgi:hypothetical protein